MASFLKIGLPISLIVTILLWSYGPQGSVPVWNSILLSVFSLVMISTLALAAYDGFKISKFVLPRVLMGKDTSSIEGAMLLCLLELSELFSYDNLVSFYHLFDEGFEQLIGVGSVINIQEDGKIQVIMTQITHGNEEVVSKLKNNDASTLKKTIAKSNVPKTYLSMRSR